jgi:hypothetical protein
MTLSMPNFENSIHSKEIDLILDTKTAPAKGERRQVAVLVPKTATLTCDSSALVIDDNSATYGRLELLRVQCCHQKTTIWQPLVAFNQSSGIRLCDLTALKGLI